MPRVRDRIFATCMGLSRQGAGPRPQKPQLILWPKPRCRSSSPSVRTH